MERNRGFSFVEFLVGLAIITIALGTVGGLSVYLQSQKTREVSSQCERMSSGSLANLRAIGAISKVGAYNIQTGRIEKDSLKIEGFESNQTWNEPTDIAGVITASNSSLVFQSYKVLSGSMMILNTLYNRGNDSLGRAYCSAATVGGEIPYDPGQRPLLIAENIPGEMTQTETLIKIERVNLFTGERDCPPPPIFIRPATHPSMEAVSSIGSFPANSSDQHGFFVTVTTQFINGKQQRQQCQSAGQFSYPRLTSESAGLSIANHSGLILGEPYNTWGSMSTCQIQKPRIGFMIQYPNQFQDSGLFLLCRDSSISGNPTQMACDPSRGGIAAEPVNIPNRWVPCQEVTVCGRPISATEIISETSSNQNRMLLGFTDLPWGCRAILSVRSIDPGGGGPPGIDSIPIDIGIPPCAICPGGTSGAPFCPEHQSVSYCITDPPPMDGGSWGNGGGGGGGESSGNDPGHDTTNDGRADTAGADSEGNTDGSCCQ